MEGHGKEYVFIFQSPSKELYAKSPRTQVSPLARTGSIKGRTVPKRGQPRWHRSQSGQDFGSQGLYAAVAGYKTLLMY